MDAVILFSHGSLLCGAGEALKVHARTLRKRGVAPLVEVGYLNYSEPPFAETVAKVVAQGATRILVAPYFLVPGKFVRVDLPRAVETARATHPGVCFVVAEAIGYDEALAEALIGSAQRSFGPESWHEDLQNAVRFCRATPECPLYATVNCPRTKETGDRNQETEAAASSTSSSFSPPLFPQAALLIMVHGSPRPIANEEMFRVVDVVKQRGVFPIVETGFMECNAPSIPEAIATCVAQGAQQILAVPYFLHTGTHVAEDLPTLLEEGRVRYPAVDFRMGAYLGQSERLTDILEARVRAVL